MDQLRLVSFIFIICTFSACSDRFDSLKERPQSVTIVLSKANSSSTYQNFIQKLDTTIEINWVNAYTTPLSELDQELKNADGIILTGGVDIHPGLYDNAFDTIRCGTIDIRRDELEGAILEYALENGTPCLGVCRGLQFMNVYLGGSLHTNLPDTLSNIHRGLSGAVNHPIEIIKNIGVFKINVADILDPVSHHHQGISRLAEDLEVWAIAPDGLAEGVRHKDTIAHPFFVGVQWHPERSGDVNSLAIPIGEGFLKSVLNYE
jgi:putative glutamine amidotransferase